MNFFRYYKTYRLFAQKNKSIYYFSFVMVFLFSAVLNLSTFTVGQLINEFKLGDINLFRNIGLIALTLVLPSIFESILFTLRNKLYVNVYTDVLKNVYSKTLLQDYDYHTKRSSGKLINIILKSDTIVDIYLYSFELILFMGIIETLVIITFIAIVSPKLIIPIIITQCILIYPEVYSITRSVRLRRSAKNDEHEVAIYVSDILNSYENVRSFRKENFEINRFFEIANRLNKSVYSYMQGFRLIDMVIAINQILTVLLTASVAIKLYTLGEITFANLVVVISFLLTLKNKVSSVLLAIRNAFKDISRLEDTVDLLNLPESVVKIGRQTIDLEKPIDIKFENISFKYNSNKPIINNLSLEIKHKEDIAFVGPSGGGKTTLVKLLLRYYLVDS